MHDARAMHGIKSVSDLNCEADSGIRIARATPSAFLERLTFEQLRDDVGHAVLRVHVIDDDDVRMIQGGGGTRLQLEATQTIRIRTESSRQHFNCDVPAQARIARPIYLPHTAGANRGEHFVRAEANTGRK